MRNSTPTEPIRVGEYLPGVEAYTLRSAVAELPYYGELGQDMALCDDVLRLYGAIDGMGKYPGAREAAVEIHRGLTDSVGRNARAFDYGTAIDLMHAGFTEGQTNVTAFASEHAGYSEMGAVVAAGHFFEQEGRGFFAYGIVGDAQFMLLRQSTGELFMSEDEAIPPGELGSKGQIVTNAIQAGGIAKLKQFGIVEVMHGDRILMMSDGITGDTNEQRLRPEELRYAMALSDPEEVARYLLMISRKRDDKTIVVTDVMTASGDTGTGVLPPPAGLLHYRFEPSGRLVQVGGPQTGRFGMDSVEELARLYRNSEEGSRNLRLYETVTQLLRGLLPGSSEEPWVALVELAEWSTTDDGEFVHQALKEGGVNLRNRDTYFGSRERVVRILYAWAKEMEEVLRIQSVREDLRHGSQVPVLKRGRWGMADILVDGWSIDHMLPDGRIRVVSGKKTDEVSVIDLVRWKRGEI